MAWRYCNANRWNWAEGSGGNEVFASRTLARAVWKIKEEEDEFIVFMMSLD